MTSRKQATAPAISRDYKAAPDVCAHAVEILLASKKKGGPATAPDDAERRSNEIRAKDIILK